MSVMTVRAAASFQPKDTVSFRIRDESENEAVLLLNMVEKAAGRRYINLRRWTAFPLV
ncbi:hypothetical protein D3C71_2212750 [compost metagenome]